MLTLLTIYKEDIYSINYKIATMKNQLFGIIAVIMCFIYSPNTHAQDEAGFAPRHVYLDLGIGLPSHGSLGHHSWPGLSANLQYGFDMFSAGFFSGFNLYGDDDDHERTSRFTFGASFSWHIWYFLNHKLDLGLGAEKLDLYVTALLGGEIEREDDLKKNKTSAEGEPFFGGVAGAKYYFVKNFGMFLEFGYGSSSFATVGLAFKF